MSRHRLSMAHPDWKAPNLAEAVRRSERWARKCLSCFKKSEIHQFSMYLSQSRAPKTRHRETPDELKDMIGDLRETMSEKYHRQAGADLIRHYLLADKDLKDSDFFIPTSTATITKILRERGWT